MKKHFHLFILACLCFTACKKDEYITESDGVTVGTNRGMIITSINTVLVGAYHNQKSMDIDVNKDNVPDFRFTSEIWGSPGLGQHPKSSFACLDANCLVYGFIKMDTTFVHHSKEVYSNPDNTVSIYNKAVFSCSRTNAEDSIMQILADQFRGRPKRNGDFLSKLDVFQSASITLSNDWSSMTNLVSNQNDTIIYNSYVYDFSCDYYPSDEICYIGFKIKDSKGEKLGWFKISISDNYKISIIESAIQK